MLIFQDGGGSHLESGHGLPVLKILNLAYFFEYVRKISSKSGNKWPSYGIQLVFKDGGGSHFVFAMHFRFQTFSPPVVDIFIRINFGANWTAQKKVIPCFLLMGLLAGIFTPKSIDLGAIFP